MNLCLMLPDVNLLYDIADWYINTQSLDHYKLLVGG